MIHINSAVFQNAFEEEYKLEGEENDLLYNKIRNLIKTI